MGKICVCMWHIVASIYYCRPIAISPRPGLGRGAAMPYGVVCDHKMILVEKNKFTVINPPIREMVHVVNGFKYRSTIVSHSKVFSIVFKHIVRVGLGRGFVLSSLQCFFFFAILLVEVLVRVLVDSSLPSPGTEAYYFHSMDVRFNGRTLS